MTATAAPTRARRLVPAGRVVGVDAARFLALAGMMATHILAPVQDGQVTLAQQVAGGRSSALFALLAGLSLALMSGRREPVRGRAWAAAAAGIAVRAGLIALIGLLLGELESGIAVILTYYGLLFLFGIPFLGLGARALAATSAVWLVAAPVVSHLLRPALPAPTYASPRLDMLLDPWRLFTELAFTGYYPAFTWLAYLLAGMALGRSDLTRWRTIGTLLGGGAVLAVASRLVSERLLETPGVMRTLDATFTGPGRLETLDLTLTKGLYGTTPTGSWWWLGVWTPHTATPFDLAQTIGSALVVVALCLALGKVLPATTAVLFGAGAMTLTLYSLHVWLRVDGGWDGHTVGTWVGQVLAALVVGALYRLAKRRGPLEAAVGAPADAVRRALSPAARS